MKTYEEMAQSVLSRAKAHKTLRNRWIVGSVAAVCAFGIGFGTLAMKPHNPQPTPISEAPTVEAPRITFLHTDGVETTQLERGVKVPVKSQLRVRDVRGMTDEQVEAACLEEQEYAEQLIATGPEGTYGNWTQYDGHDREHNLVLTYINVGKFVLNVTDPEQVERIHLSTKTGAVVMHAMPRTDDYLLDEEPFAYPKPLEYAWDHEAIQEYYYAPSGGIPMGSSISSPLMHYLNENPIPLSQISETLTFTVDFCDGTQETYVIDMIFNDNGEVYAMYLGAAAMA